MGKDHIDIFLCERIPSENRGEAAILEGLVEGFRKYIPNYDLTIYSMRLDKDRRYYSDKGIKVIGFNYLGANKSSVKDSFSRILLSVKLLVSGLFKKTVNIRIDFSDELFSAFSQADVILQGHDNVYRHNIKLKDALVVFFAKQYRKPVVIPAASIGPFETNTFLKKWMTNYVLNESSLITLRDVQSGQFLKRIGFNGEYHVLTDLAFMLKPQIVKVPWENQGSKLTIGFTPTKYVFQSAAYSNGKAMTPGNMMEETCNYLAWISKDLNAKIILIPHVYGPEKKQDDRFLIDAIYQKLIINNIDVEQLKETYEASGLKHLISRLDLLIACRTHSLIAALGAGTPVIAFTDPHRYKTNGILGNLFCLPQYLWDVTKWDFEKLKKLTLDIIDDKANVSMEIKSKRSKVLGLSEKNVKLIKNLFRK